MFKLSDAIKIIENKPEFSIKDKGSYTVIDYNLKHKNTFVGETDNDDKILLNLRGTAFDNTSGKIIRLGYNTFFNWGEHPELDKNVDLSFDHVITQKLDGSCIFPIYTNDGIFLGTRAGVTDVSMFVDKYISKLPHRNYQEFIRFCRDLWVTPIFEYCSKENRVVLDYPEPMLVLHGIRDIKTGKYFKYAYLVKLADNYTIPVVSRVESITQTGLPKFQEYVKHLINDEGVVIRMEAGEMVDYMWKQKSDEYVLRHKAVDQLQFEKDVILLHLNGLLDDIYPILDVTLANQIQTYSERLNDSIFTCLDEIHTEFFKFKHLTGDRKEFALAIKDNKYKQFLFKLCSDIEFDVSDMLFEHCRKNCSTQASAAELKLFLNFDEKYK